MFFEIGDKLEIKEIDLYIAKPNLQKNIVGHLTEAHNITLNYKMGNLSEISFEVPYYVTEYDEVIKNENINLLKDRYFIKAIYDGKIEWFRIDKNDKSSDDTKDSKRIHAFSLGIELGDKTVRLIEETSKDIKYMLSLCFTNTNWTYGFVDNELTGLFRSFDITESTKLDFLYQIAETYKGVVVWDTVNRKVDIKSQNNVGHNNGLSISYGKYLKTLEKESDSNEMTTRLIPRGQDELTIRSVSVNGMDYIDDFSYFLYPFNRDINRNVIKSSYYMTDGLCHALLDYNELLNSKETIFSNLMKTRDDLNKLLLADMAQLDTLNTQLLAIQDSIDIELSNGRTAEAVVFQANEQAKLAEISAKNVQIDSVKAQLATNQVSIEELKVALSTENNFTVDQIKELNTYIIEKVWTDTNIIRPEDLLKEGRKAFEELKKPKTVFTIDIVDFTRILETFDDWGKLNIGDTIYIHHEILNENLTAKIIEFDINFDEQSVSLTIANTNDILSAEDKFYEQLYNANMTTTTIDVNKYKWNDTGETVSEIGQIIEHEWDATKRRIVAGVNESVVLDNRGLTITNPSYPNEVLIAQAGVLAISDDGRKSWKHAVTCRGIVGERVFGRLVAGENLIIDASNANGKAIFKVDGSGVKIEGTSLEITGGLPAEQLNPDFRNGLFEINKNYSNGIRMDSSSGLVVTRSDSKVKSTFNATSGIKIEKNTGTTVSPTWQDIFYVDLSGNLVAENLITRRISIRDRNNGTIIDADTGTIDFSKFPNKIGFLSEDNIPQISADKLKIGTIDASVINVKNLSATNINTGTLNANLVTVSNLEVGKNVTMGTGARISWAQVTSQPYIPKTASDVGAKPVTYSAYDDIGWGRLTEITSAGVYTGSITADQINAGYISANRISGGMISGVEINVSTDATIGNNLYIGDQSLWTGKGIYFSMGTSIRYSTLGLYISCIDDIVLSGGSGVYIGSSQVATQAWVTANFAPKK